MLAGVDGIRNGWIAAILREGGSTEVKTFPTFRSLEEETLWRRLSLIFQLGCPTTVHEPVTRKHASASDNLEEIVFFLRPSVRC